MRTVRSRSILHLHPYRMTQQKKSVVFCWEWYEENLKSTQKTDGDWTVDHQDYMEENIKFVQRIDCLTEPVKIKVK